MSIADMRIGFDYYKSVGDIKKLRDQVAGMDVGHFEKEGGSFWEEAFHLNLFALMLSVQDAGKVKDPGKNDKKNPDIEKIFGKLYALQEEVAELVEKIKEDIKNNSGCMGSGSSVWLIGRNTEKRRAEWVQKLKDCFG